MRVSLALLALAGCSEYDLSNGTQTEEPGEVCESGNAPSINVDLNLECDIGLQTGTFTPVVEFQVAGIMGYGPIVAGQLTDDNGDGAIDDLDTPDLVYQGTDYNSWYPALAVIDGATGEEHWRTERANSGVGGQAVGDLEGDGYPEVVFTNYGNEIVVMDNEGHEIWSAYNNNTNDLYDFGYPALADLDNDGVSEVIFGKTIYSANGGTLGEGQYGIGCVPNESGYLMEGSAPVPADLDGDGELEVVVGNAAYRIDGSAKYYNGGEDGAVAVADFDLDGLPEIVAVGGNRVWTMESDMTPTGWEDTFSGANYLGIPAIDDLDGDGEPDFVTAGAGMMRAYHWDGTLIWQQTIQDYSGAAGPSLFDFERDGYPEVVFADESSIRVFDGFDGTVKMASDDHQSGTGFECPIIGDFDNDGEAEIALQHSYGTYGLTVFGDLDHSWGPSRTTWNQHAYSITNVNEDLSIPSDQEPNWETYNNFRSADAGLPPAEWRDVVPELVESCVTECPDTLGLMVRVWNQGTAEVPAGVPVVVRAGEDGAIVAEGTVPDPIASGQSSEGLELVFAVADLGGAQPVVEVDRSSSGNQVVIGECDEDNNRLFADSCP